MGIDRENVLASCDVMPLWQRRCGAQPKCLDDPTDREQEYRPVISNPVRISGHPGPVMATPAATSKTSPFAITSFQAHSHMVHMSRSSLWWRINRLRQLTLA